MPLLDVPGTPHRRCAGFKNVSLGVDCVLSWEKQSGDTTGKSARRHGKAYRSPPPSAVFPDLPANAIPRWDSEMHSQFHPHDPSVLRVSVPDHLKPLISHIAHIVAEHRRPDQTTGPPPSAEGHLQVPLSSSSPSGPPPAKDPVAASATAEPIATYEDKSQHRPRPSDMDPPAVSEPSPAKSAPDASTKTQSKKGKKSVRSSSPTKPPTTTTPSVIDDEADAPQRFASSVKSQRSARREQGAQQPVGKPADAAAKPEDGPVANTLLLDAPRRRRPKAPLPSAEELQERDRQRRAAQRQIRAKWDHRRKQAACTMGDMTRSLSDTAVAFYYGRRPFATFGERLDSHLSFNITPELYPNRPQTTQTVDSAIERALVARGPIMIGCKDRIRRLQRKRTYDRLQRRQEALSRLRTPAAPGQHPQEHPVRTEKQKTPSQRQAPADGYFVQL
ncbi:Uncharacterized protein PBTT_01407 [Plasmodiophora brassicae]|uniref:Uncharacterized protein n=1 Tax=Plasmodiophora brassicae TaxID=37360 RepID=A0A3P3Y257_PLABS|nr:unnamed protein product [Plasmodiophora brassicae]